MDFKIRHDSAFGVHFVGHFGTSSRCFGIILRKIPTEPEPITEITDTGNTDRTDRKQACFAIYIPQTKLA